MTNVFKAACTLPSIIYHTAINIATFCVVCVATTAIISGVAEGATDGKYGDLNKTPGVSTIKEYSKKGAKKIKKIIASDEEKQESKSVCTDSIKSDLGEKTVTQGDNQDIY